jgi:putative membrane protein
MQRERELRMLVRMLGGFLMALADSVPGVSGGTIAFILGLYDEFITSLNNITCRDKEKRKAAFLFLIKLGTGWVVGMALAAIVITSIFESHIYQVSSLFLGFVLFSIPLIISEEKDSLKGKYQNLVFTLLGIVLVVGITYFSKHAFSYGNVDLRASELSVLLCIYLFVAAMCAISAMVLPGISGSTLMLVFGIYQPIMMAIKGLLTMDLSYIPAIFVFGCGVLAGIFTIVKGLRYGLEKHRSAMIYFILGMMLGSFYAIIMGPTAISEPVEPLSLHTFGFVFFVAGGIIILGLQALKGMFEKKEHTNQNTEE